MDSGVVRVRPPHGGRRRSPATRPSLSIAAGLVIGPPPVIGCPTTRTACSRFAVSPVSGSAKLDAAAALTFVRNGETPQFRGAIGVDTSQPVAGGPIPGRIVCQVPSL